MEVADLSTGCIESIMKGIEYTKPVLQILGTKKISSGEGTERIRLLVSDGKYLNSLALLSTQLNDLHAKGKLVENTIVRVERYITSIVNKSENGDERVLIILDLTVLNLGTEVGKKVGNPVPYTGGEKPAASSEPSTSLNNNRSSSMNGKTSNYGSGSTVRPMDTSPHKPMNSSMMLSQSLNTSVTHPIASLSPYQNKWVIKARVMSKSAVRTWSNAKGEGKLFSMDLMDESGEIRATAFREQVDKFYDMIEVDKVYFISKCQLKPANKQYNKLNNDYEIIFTNETSVQLCKDTTIVPQVRYNFVPICQIVNMEPNAAVDVIGVCREVSDLQVFTGRNDGLEYKKRDIKLVDSSNARVTLTIWGDEAVNFHCNVSSIILIKGARVKQFGGGKSLSSAGGTTLKINPDIPQGLKLQEWFDNGGRENISVSVSASTGATGNVNYDLTTFYEADMKYLGYDSKPSYFQTYAFIHAIKQKNAFYKACPKSACNKKVIDENNGYFWCEKCNSRTPNFEYRLCTRMLIGDWTSDRWVTCFSDVGEQIFGCSAQEIGSALENDSERAEEIFSSANFKPYIFKLQASRNGNTLRKEFIIRNATKLNHKEYNNYLIQNLQESTSI